MTEVKEVVRETLLILKGKKLPDGAQSIHKDLSVWKKFARHDHPWRQIKAAPKTPFHRIHAEKKEDHSSHSAPKNENHPESKDEFHLVTDSVKTSKEPEKDQLQLFTNLSQPKVNPNLKPVFTPGKLRNLGELITEIKNTLIASGLETRAKEFLDLAYKGENDLNKILNLSYRFVKLNSENANKIIRSLVSEKVKETKKTLSEAMLGNDNAKGEHHVQSNAPSFLNSNYLSGVVSELQNESISLSDKNFIERVKTSLERKQIPLTIKTKVNEEITKLENKESSIVLKILRTYISDSLLTYNEKNNPQPIDDDSPVKRSVISSKFRLLADNMEESIQYKESPPISRQNPTRRRAGIAASMNDDAERMRRIQAALYGLAGEVEEGTLPEYLKRIKSKKDIEVILSVSKYLDSYRRIPYSNDLKPLDSKVSVGFHKFFRHSFFEKQNYETSIRSDGQIYWHNLEWILKKGLISKKDYETILNYTLKDRRSENETIYIEDLSKAEELKRIYNLKDNIENCLYAKRADKKSKKSVTIKGEKYELFIKGKSSSNNYSNSSLSMLRLGLDTYEKIQSAGKHLQGLIDKNTGRGPDPKLREIKKLENELIGSKIPGFFPTPKPLAQRLVQEAEISPGMEVLEPSAGKGDLSETILDSSGIKPDTIEYYGPLREILQKKEFNLVGQDFLEFKDKQYDRIIMNPPFEKGQDAIHVQHAYALLKPGGRLVSIMSEGPFFRGDSKSKQFRDWLDKMGGESEPLPEGSFLGSEAFRQTGVNTRIVILDKPKERTSTESSNSHTEGFTQENPNARSEAMRGNDNAKGEHDTIRSEVTDVLPNLERTKTQDSQRIQTIVKESKKLSEHNNVQSFLDSKEKNKEYKDVNKRVPGSRKELAAISKLIKISDLEKLDPVTAERVVKKERVLPPFEYTEYKNKGEDGGLVFLKSKIYESIASKPADSEAARKEYVELLNKVLSPILKSKSTQEILDYANSFSRNTLHNKYGTIIFSQIETYKEEISKPNLSTESLNEITKNYKDSVGKIVPGIETIFDKIQRGEVKELYQIKREIYPLLNKYYYTSIYDENLRVLPSVFGDRLFNILHRSTSAGSEVWNKAVLYNPLDEQTASKLFNDNLEKLKIEKIVRIESFKKAYPTFEDFKSEMGFYSEEKAKKIYEESTTLKNLPTREEWSNNPLYKVRESDWSWAEKKNSSSRKENPNKNILKRSPLGVIIRQNGRSVKSDEISSKALTENWGFGSVQFGHYMNDIASKDHITRFVSSLKDLEDCLEIDLKKAIEKGHLSLAFGARGKPGQAASYESGYKIINITKTKGDGSVAHEFCHFFDHICTGIDRNRSDTHYISINPSGAFEKTVRKINNVIKRNPNGEFSDFYKNGHTLGKKDFKKPNEYFARAFEAYVQDKLEKRNMINTYLVAPNKVTDDVHPILAHEYNMKYPQGEERTRIFEAFDDFISVFKSEFQFAKPFDVNAPRISSIQENLDTISDIVKEKKKKSPIPLLIEES
ncbi:methyltransferase [Leptospira sp. FAT2]|uniref:LPD1 domain-containing protein n=1 Tax=Leptospira sanjuanensis TaxID=2879643 RepID=UPI001EE8F225|nr:LPD1 domain-containing protein [Leptospira sanjuanensis]MCG6195654.1 methyltransferase [Leptospira sanjuanensis]